MRFLNGVGEGPEISDMLPFSANLDFQNSISFAKGCYLGQELTARTYHTGIIRKRIFPFVVISKLPEIGNTQEVAANVDLNLHDETFNENLANKVIKNKNGQTIGKVLSFKNNVGLAVVNYLKLEKEGNYFGTIDQHMCQIYQLLWTHKKIQAYIKRLKDKQIDVFEEDAAA